MPNTIPLTDRQFKYLQQHKKLLVVVPMVPQPMGKIEIVTKDDFKQYYDSTHDAIADATNWRLMRCPHRLGDRVECEYVVDVPYSSIPVGDGVENEYGGPEQRYWKATINTDPVPLRIEDITEEQAMAAGFKCRSDLAWGSEAIASEEPYKYAVRHGHRAAFINHWHTTSPTATHGWAFEIRSEV